MRAQNTWAKLIWRVLAWGAMLTCYAPLASLAQQADRLIDEALVGAHRSDANKARDKYRHPKETLLFSASSPT